MCLFAVQVQYVHPAGLSEKLRTACSGSGHRRVPYRTAPAARRKWPSLCSWCHAWPWRAWPCPPALQQHPRQQHTQNVSRRVPINNAVQHSQPGSFVCGWDCTSNKKAASQPASQPRPAQSQLLKHQLGNQATQQPHFPTCAPGVFDVRILVAHGLIAAPKVLPKHTPVHLRTHGNGKQALHHVSVRQQGSQEIAGEDSSSKAAFAVAPQRRRRQDTGSHHMSIQASMQACAACQACKAVGMLGCRHAGSS